jgi:hypothetical protein
MVQIILADGGYMSRENIEALDGRTDLIGPCIGAQHLEAQRQRNGTMRDLPAMCSSTILSATASVARVARRQSLFGRSGVGKIEHTYSATAAQCSGCPDKALCSPKSKLRSVLRIQESCSRAFPQKGGRIREQGDLQA